VCEVPELNLSGASGPTSGGSADVGRERLAGTSSTRSPSRSVEPNGRPNSAPWSSGCPVGAISWPPPDGQGTTLRLSDPRFAARPAVRLDRRRLSEEEIERARRERRAPRFTQWDYLHLSGLRRGLVASFRCVPPPAGPVLDLFCGTKPYLELIPWRPVWGLDLDDHFGRADVIGEPPLPFPDGTFGVVICSQALHLVDDPVGTLREMARVLTPGGHAIVTIPHLFLAEGDFERHWSQEDLGALFAGWQDVRMGGIDGPGAALAFVVGRLAMLANGRWHLPRAIFASGVVALNAVCLLVDVLSAPVHPRWPHSLVLVAVRPSDTDPEQYP
jgi:SAM-dependent methyltransferase